MTDQRERVVVVGVGEGDETEKAVLWAAEYAERTGYKLRLVHAFAWSALGVDLAPSPGITVEGLNHAAQEILDSYVMQLKSLVPDVVVETHIIPGRPADVLLALSKHVDLIVVGSRGLGKWASVIMGSTSLALAAGAHCACVVVRGNIKGTGAIAAAYDGSRLAELAVQDAARLAVLYGSRVELVHKKRNQDASAGILLEKAVPLAESIAPNLNVSLRESMAGKDPESLVKLSEAARMIVTAPRTRSALASAMSSSSVAVLRYANVPVWLSRPAN